MNDLSRLLANDVHVWSVRISGGETCTGKFRAILSPQELSRSAKFCFENLRREYLLKHGVQRVLLSRYLTVAPSQIEFEYGAHGKPRISGAAEGLSFNQSDSFELAVFALARDLELGVDIEVVRDLQNMSQICELYFAPEENEELRGLAPQLFETSFFKTWTRKEAYVKAIGNGLSVSLRSFQLAASGKPRIIHIDGDNRESEQWQVHSFTPAKNYVGALVYRGKRRLVRYFGVFDPVDFLDAAETVAAPV